MSLTENQRRKVYGNLKKLDYLEGTGLSEKNKMVEELFLIISAGGVGGKALREIKRLALRQIEDTDVKNQIMFLCVDTDHAALNGMLDRNELEEDEILKIPYMGAGDSISPDIISPSMKEWVHPDLYDIAFSKDASMAGMVNSAIRQCGRVMFAQPESQNELYNRLKRIEQKVVKMHSAGISNIKVNVIFLAGIAGGTGSGTIIDLGFLTRHYLRQILPGWEGRISYSAYLFLPSAFGTPFSQSEEIRGNRNAYAALKEIDHFMEIKNLGETFRMDYGTPSTHNIEIRDNLFDCCTLIEGNGAGGVIFDNPLEAARKTTALFLVNSFCARRPDQKNWSSDFITGAFWGGPYIRARIAKHSDKAWPREANYHFHLLGCSSCVVPVDILTLCAFKKVFDHIYQVFKTRRQVTPQKAQSFLQYCGLDLRTVERDYRKLTRDFVSAQIEHISAEVFKEYGPYYVIELTEQAVNLITDPVKGYMGLAHDRLNGFISNKNKWSHIFNLYSYAAGFLIQRNRILYDVYAYVIEEMQAFLQHNTGILTGSAEWKDLFGYSCCWTPFDLTAGRSANDAVIRYLDEAMNTQRVNRLACQFVEQMCARQERWTSLADCQGEKTIDFNIAEEIRIFIRDEMADIAGKTPEDYIVVAFSGDPHARLSENLPDGTMVPSLETRKAAQWILRRLTENAFPLASLRPDFALGDCYQNMYLTIPAKCRWLYEAMREVAVSFYLPKENILCSSGGDSITLSTRYEGVPAWAAKWTSAAEQDYEAHGGPYSIGIHIEQGRTGRKVMELPNLIPAGLWTDQQAMINGREKSIIRSVRDDMKEALDRGLLIPHQDLYLMTRFAEGETADTLWTFLQMTKEQKCTPEHMLDLLKKSGKAHDSQVVDFGTVTTDPGILTPEEKDAFAYDLSCRIVRKNDLERRELARTLAIGRELQSRLEELNKE